MITNAAFEAGVARTVVARPVKLHRTQIHTSIVTCVECGGGEGSGVDGLGKNEKY